MSKLLIEKHGAVTLFTLNRPEVHNNVDDELAVLLEPWAGHRHRVQRLVELAGLGRPRRGPRMAPRTHLPRR